MTADAGGGAGDDGATAGDDAATAGDDAATAGDDAATADAPVLETRRLTRRFGELVALDDVSLSVERGEFRSVIGPNGAGKTTLFNCVTGALAPSSGRVLFRGTDVTDRAPNERVRLGMGRSFQITTVFSGLSVRENVRLAAQAVHGPEMAARDWLVRPKGAFPAVTERTADVLDRVGLAARADERAGALAYGDRRRLEIGIVLATDPALVLLDEPTAGMSPEETADTMALVDDVLGERTVLLVEHDVDLVMDVSDTVTVLHRGRELTTGTPAAVAADDDVQAAYLGGVDV